MVPEGISFLGCLKIISQFVMFPSVFQEFPAPKNENFQQFQVYYLGSEVVSKPVGKEHTCSHSSPWFPAVTLMHQCCVLPGMDVINDALETAVSGRVKNNWIPVSVNVAPATLTITAKQVTNVPLADLCHPSQGF